jgi:hypothetical protein
MIWSKETVAYAEHIGAIVIGWQVIKSQIIEQLGQADILLPSLVAEGLAANDRIKVRMSALQAAAHHAREPEHPANDLQVECRAAGVAPAALATPIGGAHLVGESISMKISDITGPSCASVYEVAESFSAEGSPGRAECTVCGKLLESWQAPKLRAYRLVMSPERKYRHIPAPPPPTF